MADVADDFGELAPPPPRTDLLLLVLYPPGAPHRWAQDFPGKWIPLLTRHSVEDTAEERRRLVDRRARFHREHGATVVVRERVWTVSDWRESPDQGL